MQISGKETKPYSLMFRGCSSLIIYEAAVWAALKDYSPDLLKSASRVYGASAGSVVAAFGLCGCDIGDTINILKCLLNKHLPPNAHQLVSGKLHVIVTRVRDCRSVTISEFASKEDLMQAIVCSCYIPLYFGFLPPLYHGVRYVDGEIGMWRSNLVSRTTITVSAFAGEFDICPKDGPAGFFTLQLSDCIFQISKKNMSRFLNIIMIPSYQVLNQFYICGYQDTVSFLERLSACGISYFDEDFLLSLSNESHQEGEGTLHWNQETRLLGHKATDSKNGTEENPGTTPAADEVKKKAPRHRLHQKDWTQKTGEPSAFRSPASLTVTSGTRRRKSWSAMSVSLFVFVLSLSLSTFWNWLA